MTSVDDALALFNQGYNCAQAVCGAFGPRLGMSREQCLTVATGFGGGLGRSAEVCGAVTGAIMVLGLRYGGDTLADPAAKTNTYIHVQEFLARFKAQHGTICCRELLGADISTEEGFQRATARDFHHNDCPRFVRTAAEILEEMLGEADGKAK